MTGSLFSTDALVPGALRAALAAVAGRDRAVLLMRQGAALSIDAEGFAAAALAFWAASGEPAGGACLSLPRFLPGGRVALTPVEDGSHGLYGRAVPQAAALFTPAQAERLLAHWSGTGDEGLLAALEATGGFLLFPRAALAHDGGCDDTMQRLLAMGRRAWRLRSPGEALAVYDRHWELVPEAARRIGEALADRDFTVDLWGRTGAEPTSEFLLSSRPCRQPIAQFALELVPPEANLAAAGAGDFFSLGRWQDFAPMTDEARERLFRHTTRFNDMGDYARQLLGPLGRLIPGKGQ